MNKYTALNDGSDKLDGLLSLFELLQNQFAADFTPEEVKGALLIVLDEVEETVDHLERDLVLANLVQDKTVIRQLLHSAVFLRQRV